MRGKAAVPLLCAGALALLLSGCSALGFLFGPDQGEVDLVVVNDSARAVYAISLDAGDWSETVSSADGFPLLERGELWPVPGGGDTGLYPGAAGGGRPDPGPLAGPLPRGAAGADPERKRAGHGGISPPKPKPTQVSPLPLIQMGER